MEIKKGKYIFDEIKNLQDSMNNKYLNQFEILNDKKWVAVDDILTWVDSIHDGLFSDRNWKKILKSSLKKVVP